MMKALGLLGLIVVLMGMQDWHNHNDHLPFPTERAERPAAHPAAAPATIVERPLPIAVSGKKPITADDLKNAYDDALRIVNGAKTYQVPEFALFGIWGIESYLLRSGWSEKWPLAQDLAKQGGVYADRYEMLRALCNQRRNGQPICDPHQVRTSSAMAMGLLQHMPDTLLHPHKGGGYEWAAHAVDANHDGVRDPNDPDDAMAMTALLIRKHHDAAVAKGDTNPWRTAIIAYSGRGNDPYYDGRIVDGKRRAGVVDYATAWQQCRKQGDCPAMIARLRAR